MAHQFSTLPPNTPGKPSPFTLHIPDADLADFKDLLRLSPIGPATYWNTPPASNKTNYGIIRSWMSAAKETWLDESEFSWRAQEKYINSFPNFKIPVSDSEVGDVSMHFTALFSKRSDAVPILFLHGYPGSFMEFLPMMELLVQKYTPQTLPYHVIVPSLPDYCLSGPANSHVEMTLERAAGLLNGLMVELGFGEGYVVQGGDLGSMLGRIMSVEYEGCKALHVNMLVLNPDQTPPNIDPTPKEQEHLARSAEWQKTGFAYALEHATRPATVGLAMASSPLALLAWIGEKHLEWTSSTTPLPLSSILSTTTLWWHTSTLPRSLYHAQLVKNMMAGKAHPITTTKALGYSCFPYDMAMLPESWMSELYPNAVFYKRREKGGHFGALEDPEGLLEDFEEFVGRAMGVIFGSE
ncbi:epoxide hydrolase family protein [Aspergillus stella-maris]|uniref:epoxide hydrolase family protein n=1 Tax=Aspergillus stella-maris TaxID=1810926 RepID=UPI003CCD489D